MHTESNADFSTSFNGFQIPKRIPIFPLPAVVFFPKTFLPLHIFEPRYRAMVADAATGGECIGMALLKEGWEDQYEGNPPIHEIGCVGRLVNLETLPEGRYNIVLHGLSRYRVRAEHYDRAYREATIDVLTDDPVCAPLDEALRAELARLMSAYQAVKEAEPRWKEVLRLTMSDEMLVHSLAANLDLTTVEKQFMLEAESLPQRTRRLIELLQFKLYEHHGSEGWV
jgi:Lon protease-like protein